MLEPMINKNPSYQTFDYRTEEIFEIDTEFDKLDTEQKRRLNTALKQIKEEREREAAECSKNWLCAAILPVLKNFAKESSSLFTIKTQENGLIIADLKNDCGFHISGEYISVKSILNLAVHVEIGMRNGSIVLSLTYDCARMGV